MEIQYSVPKSANDDGIKAWDASKSRATGPLFLVLSLQALKLGSHAGGIAAAMQHLSSRGDG